MTIYLHLLWVTWLISSFRYVLPSTAKSLSLRELAIHQIGSHLSLYKWVWGSITLQSYSSCPAGIFWLETPGSPTSLSWSEGWWVSSRVRAKWRLRRRPSRAGAGPAWCSAARTSMSTRPPCWRTRATRPTHIFTLQLEEVSHIDWSASSYLKKKYQFYLFKENAFQQPDQ